MAKLSVTQKDIELLRQIKESRGATRVWNGRVNTWMVDREPRTRGVLRLIKLGLLWTAYPVGRGDAGLNELGESVLAAYDAELTDDAKILIGVAE